MIATDPNWLRAAVRAAFLESHPHEPLDNARVEAIIAQGPVDNPFVARATAILSALDPLVEAAIDDERKRCRACGGSGGNGAGFPDPVLACDRCFGTGDDPHPLASRIRARSGG